MQCLVFRVQNLGFRVWRGEVIRDAAVGPKRGTPLADLTMNRCQMWRLTARWSTKVALWPDSMVIRDQICGASGPEVNCVMQVDF